MQDNPTIVDNAALERSLDLVRANAAGPVEGVFGPGSAIWHIDREAAVFIGAGRALLMQLAHPWVATAIADHSSALSDPIGRFHRTFEIVFTMVFGSLDQALETSRRLHQRHASIQGVITEAIGSHTAGSGYFANEVSALMWVHATLVDTALTAYQLVVSPVRVGDLQDRAAGLHGRHPHDEFQRSMRLPRPPRPAEMLDGDPPPIGSEPRQVGVYKPHRASLAAVACVVTHHAD
jgi:uncharacterized protein (DUF2236 family)